MKPILECVPNVSEGRNLSVIEELKQAISGVWGVKLLHTDIGYSANRTVFTFAGAVLPVMEAAFQLIKKAYQVIDMSNQKGTHPRIGAVDVCPFIPITGITMKETIEIADTLAQKVGEELQLPVYLYGYAAKNKLRFQLENIRKGEYENLSTKISDPLWQPDYGPVGFNKRFGATAIGARNFLIAYNVNLDTKDVKVAKEIAAEIRESGRTVIKQNNSEDKKEKIPGKLKAVKAISWYSDEYECSQVSTNIIDYHSSSIFEVFKTIVANAKDRKVEVTGSEIIGLIPLESIFPEMNSFEKAITFLKDYNTNGYFDEVQDKLGLIGKDTIKLKEKILEYKMLDMNL